LLASELLDRGGGGIWGRVLRIAGSTREAAWKRGDDSAERSLFTGKVEHLPSEKGVVLVA